MTDWKTMESAPRDGTAILIVWLGKVKYAQYWVARRKDQVDGWRVFHTAYYNSLVCGEPDCWMPLPTIPNNPIDYPN